MITIRKSFLENAGFSGVSRVAYQDLAYTRWTFPGGEVGVKLDKDDLAYLYRRTDHQTIVARLQSSADLVELAMVKDALSNLCITPIHLLLPYVLYGRQDRVMVRGESFSLLVLARMIADMDFDQVTIVDPHSEVTVSTFKALGVPLKVITQFDVIHQFQAFSTRVAGGVTFVSPDAGSNKKTSEIAKYYGHRTFIRADKLRELSTGKILETIVYADDLTGKDVLIADDLCDGGMTFIGLAAALRAKGAAKVILYVTHGLFSKGVAALLDGGIDQIFMTDSWGGSAQWGLDPRVTVLKLEETFLS